MATYIDKTDEGLITQLTTFFQKIPNHKVALNIPDALIDGLKDDAKLFKYVFDLLNPFATYSEALTGFKNLLRYGNGNEILGAIPQPIVLPTPAPAVTAANMQGRFATIIQLCVKSPNYTTTIGEDLGIEKPDTPFDPQTGKPTFKIGFTSGGHPNLIWKKGKFQGVEIWKDSGDGKFVRIDKDFSPDYADKSPLPALGQSAVWKYKLIYLYKDEVVGSYSEVSEVTVTGLV